LAAIWLRALVWTSEGGNPTERLSTNRNLNKRLPM